MPPSSPIPSLESSRSNSSRGKRLKEESTSDTTDNQSNIIMTENITISDEPLSQSEVEHVIQDPLTVGSSYYSLDRQDEEKITGSGSGTLRTLPRASNDSETDTIKFSSSHLQRSISASHSHSQNVTHTSSDTQASDSSKSIRMQTPRNYTSNINTGRKRGKMLAGIDSAMDQDGDDSGDSGASGQDSAAGRHSQGRHRDRSRGKVYSLASNFPDSFPADDARSKLPTDEDEEGESKRGIGREAFDAQEQLWRRRNEGDEQETEERGSDSDLEAGGRKRGLERTLDRIGFGPYQWRLLFLCGLGWMSDNATLQCVAIILPRVQRHYNLSPTAASMLSASTMSGMFVGAITWGSLSDILGRIVPFNATLFLTAVFGIMASLSSRFETVCFWMFWLGSAVGGSMPTDGTLFLENLPLSKQYLLTLLSVFFSFGAVLSAVIGYLVLPGASCTGDPETNPCSIENGDNDGWKKMLFILGLVNLVMFLARFFLFRLHESPRFLVAKRRPEEAAVVLRRIASFNAARLSIDTDDVGEHSELHPTIGKEESAESSGTKNEGEDLLSNETEYSRRLPQPGFPQRMNSDTPISFGVPSVRYDGSPIEEGGPSMEPISTTPTTATTSSRGIKQKHSRVRFSSQAPLLGTESEGDKEDADMEEDGHGHEDEDEALGDEDNAATIAAMTGVTRSGSTSAFRAWKEKVEMLFTPRWRRTTLLMWLIWGLMSLAYGMFNTWLPTVFEQRSNEKQGQGSESLKDPVQSALSEMLFYSIAGCPGSLIGAYSIESSLGRKQSLALFTILTALAMFAFILVKSDWAVTLSAMMISGAGTAMYAVLYGITPEAFDIIIRGTGSGTSAAMSRLTGILAPILAGFLLSVSPSLPLATSAILFAVTAVCALGLPVSKTAAPTISR